jgi:hypothetical protein
MSKPGKSLKALCKRLGVRLTVKRGKKRVYKRVAVLKRQCANKKKRRTRKYGKTLLPKLRKISKKNVKHVYKLKDPHKKRILAIDEGIRAEAKKTGRTMKKAAIAKKARFNVLRIYRKNRKLGECNKLTRDMRYIDKKYKLGKTKNICKRKRRRKFGTIAFPNPYMSVYSNGTYIGGKKDGKKHGNGIMYYNSGSIYKGNWVNGYRDGIGTILFSPSNNKYVGEWKNDKANGKGKLEYKNGDFYEGGYKDNKKHGKGYMMGLGGTKLVYKGEWEEDGFIKGTSYHSSGSKHIGHFKNYLKHGPGQHIDIDRENYKTYIVGVWDNHELSSGDKYYYEKFGEPVAISDDDEDDCYVFKHFQKLEVGIPAQEIYRLSIPHDSDGHTANSNPALRKFYKKLPLPLRSSEGFGKKRRKRKK